MFECIVNLLFRSRKSRIWCWFLVEIASLDGFTCILAKNGLFKINLQHCLIFKFLGYELTIRVYNLLLAVYVQFVSLRLWKASCTKKWPARVVAFATPRVSTRLRGVTATRKPWKNWEKHDCLEWKSHPPLRVKNVWPHLKKLCRSRSAESAPHRTTGTLETNMDEAVITAFFSHAIKILINH